MSLASTAEAHDPLLFYGLAASDSPVPTAVIEERSGAHVIRTVNAAFCRLLGGPEVRHEGLSFAALSHEPERVERILTQAHAARRVELVLDVAYRTPDAQPCFASTLVTPVIAGDTVGLVLHLFDSTALARARHGDTQAAPDLLEANLRLLVASLHAQELAEASKRQASLFERRLARKSVLAEASALLASSLDYDETVRRLASLALPELADCCAVELRVQDSLEPLALAHVDPSKEQTARTLAQTISPGAHVSFGAPQVVRAGRPLLIQDLNQQEDVLAELGPERSSMLSKLDARSYLCVPLSARGTTIGTFTLIATEPGRELGESELEFARELALHASFALENARLYRDAQQAIAMRDDVLAVVSHDLQSPLNAISMTVRRLLARTDVAFSAGTMRSLDLLQRTARHMYRLIEELLEVGSIQAGQLQLDYTTTDASALIEEAVVMIEPLAQKKGLRTHVQVERSPLGIRCDEERMLRVVVNLLGNAVKFTSEGGEVTVRAEIVGSEFLLTVQDTGPGIARVDLPKLFEPYWKGRRSGRSGMGLGLYIARGVVQAHRGRIWAESEVGVGSTFRVCLPVDAGEPESSACSTNAR